MSMMKPGMAAGAGKMMASPAQGKKTDKMTKLPFNANNVSGNAALSGLAAEAENEGSVLNGREEDGATVISASFHVTAPEAELKAVLSDELKALAARVYENEGIIGHIKASTEVKHVQMYSITDEILYVKEGQYDEIQIAFAFILFLIDVDTATAWAKEIMERIMGKFEPKAGA